MTKKYKYQHLMEEKGVKGPCPFHDCKEEDIPAYHFGYAPMTDEKNFVPGHKRNPRINAPDDIVNCMYCGLSMYKSADSAVNKWKKELPERVRKLLNYSHLLIGDIRKEIGVISKAKDDHFTLFEYEGAELRDHFKVHSDL